MKRASRGTAVYMSISAQADNLGDIVIRRNLVRWLIDSSANVHLLVAEMPASYVDAFELPPGVVLHRRTVSWLGSLLRHVVRGQAMLVYAPGPQGLDDTLRGIARGVANAALAVVCSSLARGVLIVGRAYRGSGRFAGAIARLTVRRARLVSLRDSLSAETVGVSGAPVFPDLGILPEESRAWAPSVSDRKVLALSLRSDRDLPPGLLTELIDWARDNTMTIVFVTQVRRDEERHMSLSRTIPGSVVVGWEGSHADQLERVLAAYRGSVAVVSNRLHGLLLGWTQGAQPIPLIDAFDTKIIPTLGSIHPDLHAADGRSPIGEVITAALDQAPASAAALAAGRERLQLLRELVQRSLASGSY
ncbi:polysaccharide pyruvyl transferase family protein [Blastococcus sp. SYSU DS0619]